VSYDDKVKSNRSHLLSEDMKTHNHEEADTIMPLHVIHTHSWSRLNTIDVWCPDSAHGSGGKRTLLKCSEVKSLR